MFANRLVPRRRRRPASQPWTSSAPQHGVHVLQTAQTAALQGKSGSATIAQAPYAALVGKAVALEPATGFTFDTAIVPLPY
jgi:hypothetical protein